MTPKHKIVAIDYSVWKRYPDLTVQLGQEGVTHSVSPQGASPERYVDWLNNHTVLVTDSDMHRELAKYLEKRVVYLNIRPGNVFERVKEELTWGMS